MTEIDYAILWWIQNHIVCPWLTPIMKFFTDIGAAGIVWIAAIAVMLCFKKTRYAAITTAIALLLATVFNNYVVKYIFMRPRPFYGVEIELLIPAIGGWSFASGHAASSFAAATAIFLKRKKEGAIALAVAALIAFSRNYFFVHFPSDVLGGALEGILIAVAVTALCDYLIKKFPSISGKL